MDFANMSTSDIERMMLEDAMAQSERYSKPDEGGKWLAMAQAMGAPTRTGSFGEGLGNVAGALGQYHKAEQDRRGQGEEARRNALNLVYKQKMDLEEKRAKVIAAKKPKFFQTSEGTLGFANDEDQTLDIRAVGPAQMKIVEKLQSRYTDILSKQGGYTDANQLQQAAYQLAMRDFSRMVSDTGFIAPQVGGNNPQPGGLSQLEPTGSEVSLPAGTVKEDVRSAEKFVQELAAKGMSEKQILAELAKKFGVPNKPTFEQADPLPQTRAVPTANKPIPIKTPQQIEQENAEAKTAYDLGAKETAVARSDLATYAPMKDTLATMEATTLGGMSSGVLAENLQKAGNLVSYFDPNSTLSKYASNSEAYELHLMDLVRTKIQALGAGTAISNIDLLVTKMAAGDKSLTVQGRLMLVGALKGAVENQRIENERKIDYFNEHKDLKGYKPSTDPQATMMPVMSKGPQGPTMRYDVLTYQNFKDKMAKAHPNEVDAPDFDKIVRNSFKKQSQIYREWIATGVDPRTKKAK